MPVLRAVLGVLFLNGVIGQSCTQACLGGGNISTGLPLAPSFNCPAYTTTIYPGASTIDDCLCIPGSSGANGAVECSLCLPGTFSSISGSTSCTPCPMGVDNPNEFGATNDSICTPPQTFVTITLFVNGTLSVNEQDNLRVQIADSLNISVDLIKLEQVPARRRRLLQSGGSQIIITITVPTVTTGTTGNASNAVSSAVLISSQIQNSVSLSVVQSWFVAIGLPPNLVSGVAVNVVEPTTPIIPTTTTPMLTKTTTPMPSLPASTPPPVPSTDAPTIWTQDLILIVAIGSSVIGLVLIVYAGRCIYNNLPVIFTMHSEYVPIKTRDPMEHVRLQGRYNGARGHV